MATPANNLVQLQDYETLGSGRHEALRFWLRLLTCTTLIEAKIRAQLDRHFSITLPQFDLMAQLDRVPEGLTMSALSERLMVSNGNVTGIVTRLIAEKLVDRQISRTDRRAFVVRLSRKGQTLFRDMAGQHEVWVNQLFDHMSPADIDSLMQLLARTKDAVRATTLDAPKTPRVASKRSKAAPRRAARTPL
jgi:DNA-binding MarR family transcriptional regulator